MRTPTLVTPRLRLRAHRREDFPTLAAMWADPLVTRFIGGEPSSRHDSWLRLLRYGGLWPLLGFGYWAVEEKATGRYVGDVGFADLERELAPPISGLPELGWVLAPAAHGKGYATEATRAAVAWAEKKLDAPRTVCIISPGNAGSIRVAEKLGFREVRRATHGGKPTIVFSRPLRRSKAARKAAP